MMSRGRLTGTAQSAGWSLAHTNWRIRRASQWWEYDETVPEHETPMNGSAELQNALGEQPSFCPKDTEQVMRLCKSTEQHKPQEAPLSSKGVLQAQQECRHQ